MTNTISRDLIENTLDQAGVDYNDVTDTYSGRGMYGTRCFAFTIAGKRIQRDLCKFFLELGRAAENEMNSASGDDVDDELFGKVANLAHAVCTDDLGLDMIVYFPGWTLAD
jgi:hypothetical protein